MKAVIQRVSQASVKVKGETIAAIDKGLLVLVGIGKGDLSNYFERRIIPEIDHTVNKNLEKIPDFSKKKVDIYLGHGDIALSKRTSQEEKKFYNMLKNSGATYIHGHEHTNTSRKESGINLINAGPAAMGNYGIYSLDKNNKIKHMLFSKRDKNSGDIEYEITNLDNLQPKKNYG